MIDARKGNDGFARAFAEVQTDRTSTNKRPVGYPHRELAILPGAKHVLASGSKKQEARGHGQIW